MSKQMKLIMENWRRFSNFDDLLLEETDLNKIDLPKVADIAKKNSDEEGIQTRIATTLLAIPEVGELIGAIVGLRTAREQSGQETSEQEEDELKKAGIKEGIGNVWDSLKIAALSGAAGNFDDALSAVGLGKLAQVNPKVWSGAILAIGAVGAASGKIDPTDAVKMATLAAKVGTGGINSLDFKDIEDVVGLSAGIEGGKQAEE